jgi:hypothetical protein
MAPSSNVIGFQIRQKRNRDIFKAARLPPDELFAFW